MLNTPSGSGRYTLIDTPQFQMGWTRALSSGAIDPCIAERLLWLIYDMLASNPHRFPLFPSAGEPVEMRWFDLFPGSRNPQVQIWYAVVEDDQQVHLVSVELIYPTQIGLPGFNL